MQKIQIDSESETVIERSDYPPEKIRQIMANEIVAVIGYGVQGRGQSLNMKDNGVNVIIGQRENSKSWDLAVKDGWVPGKTLFPMEEAAAKGTIIQYLLSDAGQKEQWSKL
ncbi:MAG: ketol-acid reductoisomerase, partial [Planctomycetia bacterium]|nr:ketol-acid reductoisomerase [Planctomycetia bacterium]